MREGKLIVEGESFVADTSMALSTGISPIFHHKALHNWMTHGLTFGKVALYSIARHEAPFRIKRPEPL